MSSIEAWLIIILVLGVIASNIAVLKYSAKFKMPQFGKPGEKPASKSGSDSDSESESQSETTDAEDSNQDTSTTTTTSAEPKSLDAEDLKSPSPTQSTDSADSADSANTKKSHLL
jgi:cytoskeletal protein RodZ